MILAAITVVVAIRILYCVGEMVFERDWPRHTLPGLLVSLSLLFLAVITFS